MDLSFKKKRRIDLRFFNQNLCSIIVKNGLDVVDEMEEDGVERLKFIAWCWQVIVSNGECLK